VLHSKKQWGFWGQGFRGCTAPPAIVQSGLPTAFVASNPARISHRPGTKIQSIVVREIRDQILDIQKMSAGSHSLRNPGGSLRTPGGLQLQVPCTGGVACICLHDSSVMPRHSLCRVDVSLYKGVSFERTQSLRNWAGLRLCLLNLRKCEPTKFAPVMLDLNWQM